MNSTSTIESIFTEQLIDKLEDADFTIDIYSDCVEFGKYSSAGQDFHFSVSNVNDKEQFYQNLLKLYEYFDPSEEASIWLDETGHGKNGAPYDLKDVYDDMVECEGFIAEACKIISIEFFGCNKMPLSARPPVNHSRQEDLEKAIAYWVDQEYGEADDPSWSIEGLARFLNLYLNDNLSDDDANSLETYEKPNWNEKEV